MKKLLVVLLVVTIGGVLGVGIAYADFTHSPLMPWGNSYQTCTFKVQDTFGSQSKTQFTNAIVHWNAQLTKSFLFKSSLDTQFTQAARNGVKTITKNTYGATGWTARTIPWVDLATQKYVVECDIEFNVSYQYANSKLPNAWDVQSVATHELGHALSVGHSTVAEDTLYTVPQNSDYARDVTAADREAARASTARWFN